VALIVMLASSSQQCNALQTFNSGGVAGTERDAPDIEESVYLAADSIGMALTDKKRSRSGARRST
jgi:hypothetical protein